MHRMILAVAATAVIAGPAQATTNAGAAPTPDLAFATTTNPELFAQFSAQHFGHGRPHPFSFARAPGPPSPRLAPM